MFNSEGRLTQIDYVLNAISESTCIIALKSNRHSILLTKIKKDVTVDEVFFNSRIFIINNKIGIAGSGINPDLKLIIKRARRQSRIFQSSYGEEMSARQLAKELASFIQEYTQSSGIRVLGVRLFLLGLDIDGPNIYQIEPSGLFSKIKGGAIGKNSNYAIDLLKKRLSKNLNFHDLWNIGLIIFQEISDTPIYKTNINIAGFIDNSNFRILNKRDVENLFNSNTYVL